MSELNLTSIDPVVTQVVTLTSDNTSLKTPSDLLNVSRSGGEWISFNEMPISTNSLPTLEIRPNIAAITSTNRNIAPKPLANNTAIPLRQDSICGKNLFE